MPNRTWLDFPELCRLVGVAPADAEPQKLWVELWGVNQGCRNDPVTQAFEYAKESLKALADSQPASFAARAYVALADHQRGQQAPPAGPAPTAPAAPSAPPAPAPAPAPTPVPAASTPAPAPAPEVPQDETKDEANDRLAAMLGRPDTTAADLPPVGQQAEQEKPKAKRKRRTKAEIEADKAAEQEKNNGTSRRSEQDAHTAAGRGNPGGDPGNPDPGTAGASGVPSDFTGGVNGSAVQAGDRVPDAGTSASHAAPSVGGDGSRNDRSGPFSHGAADVALPDLTDVATSTERTVSNGLTVAHTFDAHNLRVLKENWDLALSQAEAEVVEHEKALAVLEEELNRKKDQIRSAKDRCILIRQTVRLTSQLVED